MSLHQNQIHWIFSSPGSASLKFLAWTILTSTLYSWQLTKTRVAHSSWSKPAWVERWSCPTKVLFQFYWSWLHLHLHQMNPRSHVLGCFCVTVIRVCVCVCAINTWLPASKVYLFEISRFPLCAGDHSDHHAPSSAPAHFLQCFLRCLHLLVPSQPENPGKNQSDIKGTGWKIQTSSFPALIGTRSPAVSENPKMIYEFPLLFFDKKSFFHAVHIILPWCGRPTALHSHRSTPSLARCQLHGSQKDPWIPTWKMGSTIPWKITRGDPCWFLGKLSLWAGDNHPAWNQMDEYQGASSERRVPAASSHQRCDVGHHHECWEGLDANAAKVTVNVTKKNIQNWHEIFWWIKC